MDIRTQVFKVRQHLKSGKTLTAAEAWYQYGIGRLAARIHELRWSGVKVKSRLVRKGGKRFAEYSL